MSTAEVASSTIRDAADGRLGASPSSAGAASHQHRTIWGLDPVQLHTRYWASNGVQVVRQGEPSEIVRHAELFLLAESATLALFRLADLMDALNWIKPQ